MKKANKLKDDARRFELREDWDKAIQAYQRVLEMGESEGDVELPLYNRIGDLYVRVGRANEAVRYYSQAADRYSDAGLFNNAIALCNKALRYAPDNLDLLRKLGQFSASQGFLTDARRWFLDYAESAARQGRIAEALQALEDFANSTEDAELRELFGRTLQQHDQHERAVTELRHAYRLYLGAGESARAEALADYLREIAPDVSLADEQPEARSVRDSDEQDYVLRPYSTSRDADADAAGTAASAAEAEAEAEHEREAEPEAPAADQGEQLDDAYVATHAEDAGEPDGGTLEGLVGTAIGDEAGVTEADVLEGFQPTSFDTQPEDESDELELPRLETTQATELGADDVAVQLPGLEPTALAGDDAPDQPPAAADLPELDADTADATQVEEAEDAYVELPTLEESDEATVGAGDDEAALELPTLEEGDEATAEADEDEAAFELPTLDGAAESIDVEYDVDDIELPTFDTAERAAQPQPQPEPEEPDAPVQEDAGEEQAGADVVFEEPLLATDGTAAEDTSDPASVRIDRSAEAIGRVIVAARSAIDRGDVAGAVGRLLSLHQELDDAAAYGRAAEEVGALLIETPGEIRLHQVHVELAERSGDHALRLGAYLSLANALEESGGLAKAAAIYEHVLEIEPGHAAARQALDAIERKRTPQYVDLKSLLELDRPSGETRYFVNEDNPTGDEDRDFAAVLSQFKAKLAEHVAPEDAEAHYDLGLAFKEMGLLDEAIEQFQVALRTGDGRLRVYEELGDCFVQKGQFSVAVKLLERALQVPVKDEMDRVGLYYYLGAANEQLGRTDQARDSYERVLGLDMTFRDVAARLARL